MIGMAARPGIRVLRPLSNCGLSTRSNAKPRADVGRGVFA